MHQLWQALKNRLLKKLFNFFESLGIHVLPVHYYSPIPDTRTLKRNLELFERESDLPGIELNDEAQIRLIKELCSEYHEEYKQFPFKSTGDPTEYYLNNGSFGFVSGQMHYCIIRHFKPKNVIEVGSGASTLLTLKAIRRNDSEAGSVTKFMAVEPYPEEYLNRLTDDNFTLVRSEIQDVNVDIFADLKDRDLLFIDSSHVSKFNSDVNFLMFEALPRIGKGAIVHIHDIQFPLDYFKSYIIKEHHFWNEQYLVQAFLMYNKEFEILWCASYMAWKYPELLSEHFPHFDKSRIPTSLYIRKVV